MWKPYPSTLKAFTEVCCFTSTAVTDCGTILFFFVGCFVSFFKVKGSELVNPSRNVFSAVLVKLMEVKCNCFATFNKSFLFSQTTLGESILKEHLLKSEEGERLGYSNSSDSRICNVDRIRIFSVQLMLCFFFLLVSQGKRLNMLNHRDVTSCCYFLAALLSMAAGAVFA